MNLPTARPLNKITAGALASAIVIIVAWLLREYAGVDMPADVQAALTVIIGFVTSYLVPLSDDEAAMVAQAWRNHR